MMSFSSLVENLSDIIRKETTNCFEKCVNFDEEKRISSETSIGLSHEEAILLEDLRNSVEDPIKRLNKPINILQIVEDFSEMCLNIANKFAETDDIIQKNLHLQVSGSYPGVPSNELYQRLCRSLVDSISLELEHLIVTSCMHWDKVKKDERLWTSFVLHDLKRAIRDIHLSCTEEMEKKISFSSCCLRLGRIYAWARDPTILDTEDEEATQNLKRLKARILRKLSRLVLLSRAGKRHVRSHPLLATMRHELLKIRTHTTGTLLSDRTAAMGPANTEMLQLSIWDDDCDTTLSRLIPSTLRPAFSHLIDHLTDLLLKLPSVVPGVPVPLVEQDAKSEQCALWRGLVTQTVLNFYNHQDTWAGIDMQVEDTVVDLQASGKSLSLFTCFSDSSESENETDQNKPASQSGERKLSVGMNPALVQAVLDRFDHYNRSSRKRHFSGVEDQFDVEPSVPVKVSKPANPAVNEPGPTMLPSQTDETTITRSESSPARSVNLDSSGPSPSANVKALTPNRSMDDSITSDRTSPRERKERANTDRETDGTGGLASTKRRSNRSLRTRRSRTPSEASYSEGEVLSDSDEERDGSSDGELANGEAVPELSEKVNVEEVNEEQAAEIIQLVNNQLRDATPVSDIDLTELEIMDEWATPASATLGVKQNEADEGVLEELVEGSNETVDEQLARMEETNKQLSELLDGAMTACVHKMEQLILNRGQLNDSDCLTEKSKESATESISLPEETEASIERTASAFKEHVTSVLVNLLHAVPTLLDPDAPTKATGFKRANTLSRPVVCGRRGARLLGMLKSYQQDVVKRLSSSNVA